MRVGDRPAVKADLHAVMNATTVSWARSADHVALPNAAGIYPVDFNGKQAPNLESRVLLSRQTDRYDVPTLAGLGARMAHAFENAARA